MAKLDKRSRCRPRQHDMQKQPCTLADVVSTLTCTGQCPFLAGPDSHTFLAAVVVMPGRCSKYSDRLRCAQQRSRVITYAPVHACHLLPPTRKQPQANTAILTKLTKTTKHTNVEWQHKPIHACTSRRPCTCLVPLSLVIFLKHAAHLWSQGKLVQVETSGA